MSCAPIPAAARGIVLLVGAAFLSACAGPAPPTRPADGVLLIVVDALRPDHLGFHGYHRDTSPTLDRLAAGGIVFESAFSTSGWTRPSIASLFTSLHPTEHGLRQRARRRNRELYLARLDDRFQTLAERFAAAGFATFAAAGNPHLQREHGFSQGFDQFDQEERNAEEVWERFGEWMRSRRPERFFAYLHFMDVHWPYTPPAPFDERFPPPGGGPDLADFDWNRLRMQIRSGERPVDPRTLDALVARYDGGIRYFDHTLAEFLARWEAEARDWLIVVTADHGEEFLEHGGMGHGPFLYEVNLRVPLLIRPPGGRPAGWRGSDPVSLLDLYPTLLELTGLPAPGEVRGRSLVPLWTAPEGEGDRELFAEDSWEDVYSRFSIRAGRFKLIRTVVHRGEDGVPPGLQDEMFDLVEDPGETRNLIAAWPGRAEDLAARLTAHLERMRTKDGDLPGEVPIDPETEERLRSLGYID